MIYLSIALSVGQPFRCLHIYPLVDDKGLDVKIYTNLYNLFVSKYLLHVLLVDFNPSALCALL